MLLQQLASIFLCSQFPSPTDDQQTLGLHCSKERCREFLKCHAPSEATCSCFRQKGMKAFRCPWKHFVVSESGNSDLLEATRFYCTRLSFQETVVSFSPPTEHLTGIIIIGRLLGRQGSHITLSNDNCSPYHIIIRFDPLEMCIDVRAIRTRCLAGMMFPLKIGREFELKLLFRQNGYEIRVDGKKIVSESYSPVCNIDQTERLVVKTFGTRSLHFNYNE